MVPCPPRDSQTKTEGTRSAYGRNQDQQDISTEVFNCRKAEPFVILGCTWFPAEVHPAARRSHNIAGTLAATRWRCHPIPGRSQCRGLAASSIGRRAAASILLRPIPN